MVPLIENRRARHEYTILEQLEAGIVLEGLEVKSLRGKRANIHDAFVKIMHGEVYLINARIEQYATTAHVSYDPTRSRKLLLRKRQVRSLEDQLQAKGLTAVPLMIGLSGNFVKVLIGIGKGKKEYDKKAVLKKRDLQRENEAAMKRYR